MKTIVMSDEAAEAMLSLFYFNFGCSSEDHIDAVDICQQLEAQGLKFPKMGDRNARKFIVTVDGNPDDRHFEFIIKGIKRTV